MKGRLILSYLLANLFTPSFLNATQYEWTAEIRTSCRAIADTCYGAHRLAVGSAYGYFETDGSRTVDADAWFDDNDGTEFGAGTDLCPYGYEVGYGTSSTLSKTKDLILFLDGVRAIDTSASESGCVKVVFSVDQKSGMNCTGGVVHSFGADAVEYDTSGTIFGVQSLAYCDNRADCSGAEGDTCDDDWHLPDVVITKPASSGYRSYIYTITSYICDSDCSSDCTTSSESGCISVTWVD